MKLPHISLKKSFANISFKNRFLLTNLLMVVLPVCLLLVFGSTVFAVFKLIGPTQQTKIAMLWPEKGPAMLQQYALNSLKTTVEKKDNIKNKDVMNPCHLLEGQGLRVTVFNKKRLTYSTPGTNLIELSEAVHGKDEGNLYQWDGSGVAFKYNAPNGNRMWVAGKVPFLAHGVGRHNDLHDVVETVFYVLIALCILAIVLLGRYLARLMSKQILVPLAALSSSAAQIGAGNLEVPVKVDAQGEMGETCRAFEDMRVQLKGAKVLQEKYEKNRKELLAGISHDLSTPLTTLKGYASGILDGVANTPEKQHHYTEMIYKAACTMENLVTGLFLFSKLDLGRVDFKTEKVAIGQYFKNYAAENTLPLQEKGLNLTIEGDADNALVELDILQWQRVVDNILGNSIKYKKNTIINAKITLTKEDKLVKIVFADNGPGVEKEELEHIFDSFYRTDKARSNVNKGSGLGLAIVKQIVVNLKGQIRAEQVPDGGLAICITLPLISE
jgi:signal transduction histidine kinase